MTSLKENLEVLEKIVTNKNNINTEQEVINALNSVMNQSTITSEIIEKIKMQKPRFTNTLSELQQEREKALNELSSYDLSSESNSELLKLTETILNIYDRTNKFIVDVHYRDVGALD